MPKNEFIPPHSLKTAVLFLVFNRPETTRQVFEAIRKAKPPRLYLAADGPREDRPGEDEKVYEVRDYVLSNIDWDCEVKTLFRDRNLGCKYALSGAITWFFENEEMGIILEDDCLPSQSFFWFCEELLEKYKDDERIGMICGRNNLRQYGINSSYLYSTGGSIWGWATWRRVAKQYNPDHYLFKNQNIKNYLLNATMNKVETDHLYNELLRTQTGELSSWCYQWGVLLKINSMLAVVPLVNLIKNVGFGDNATHTIKGSKIFEIENYDLSFPLIYPPCIIADRFFSQQTAALHFSKNSWLRKRLRKSAFLISLYKKL